MRTDWNGKPYYSLDYYLKETFGKKIYKLALDGGMTCPNRDGVLGSGGCIFCSEGGSGEFAAARNQPLKEQVNEAILRIHKKMPKTAASPSPFTDSHLGSYIGYFQSYTNTYAPLPYLKKLFSEAIRLPELCALSIGTRPDCLPDETVALLSELNQIKPVWVELGLQTIQETTAQIIRRGYPLSTFEDAFRRLKDAGLTVIVHVILGLPQETKEMMLETVRYLAGLHIDGIKLQLLHVLKGTDLAPLYEAGEFSVLSLEEYLDVLGSSIALLPPDIVIHRISGDGPRRLLLAPEWSADKKRVLNAVSRYLKEQGIYQGCRRCHQL